MCICSTYCLQFRLENSEKSLESDDSDVNGSACGCRIRFLEDASTRAVESINKSRDTAVVTTPDEHVATSQ